MKDAFTLQEIADWQLHYQRSNVELPSIQRGFIWKPKQVEDLWDSILRGYPIGSFLFTQSGNKLYLMDGQQRSTSIFLGHFNPYKQLNETMPWTLKGELPTLWVDIKPDVKPISSKYLIRLTTQSHPWGYQAYNNGDKLSVSDRRRALEFFKEHSDNKKVGYTKFKNSTVFPFDSNFPIPLCFFIESNSANEILDKVEKFLPDYISTKRGGFENKEDFIRILRKDLMPELSEIYKDVKETEHIIIKSNIIDNRVLHEENDSENPTLFVRINSAGTALTGDDLIYSIYKSIFPETKNLIESIGVKFIAPTQVISLVSRIVSSEMENNSFVKKLTVRDFQRRIKDEKFKGRLSELIQNKFVKDLFNRALGILSCKDNPLFDDEIPPILIKLFIKKNQDLFLFLIYWLHINSDKTKLDDNLKLRIVSKLLCFGWFNFGNIPCLWNAQIENEKFWNEPLNELIWWSGVDGINFIIPPHLLKRYYEQDELMRLFIDNHEHRWDFLQKEVGNEIVKYYEHVKKEEFDPSKVKEYFTQFINCIFYNKNLILLAQREYINSTFPEYNQIDEIEDTNVPWDWDHIYPSEWVYRKTYCNQAIKDWNNSIGNLRAISLEDNRRRGNKQSPHDITDKKERKYSFIKDSDWQYWKNIDSRIWDNETQNHFRAVTIRLINIYERFWDDFKLKDLIIEHKKEQLYMQLEE